ncbi:MAG: hypothetical protein ABI779_19050 [Acidobacteriota bacterium]
MRFLIPIALLVTGCASSIQRIPASWTAPPLAVRIREVALDATGNVTQPGMPPLKPGTVQVAGNQLRNGDRVLSEVFSAIDSFDVSESRGEVVFSAKREASFDIGLVATDGGATHWIPAEPSDEVHVQWAPRGSKVSYFVRAPLGDLVRTFHVPTSYQYALDFGPATLYDLGWDPQAEHFAVSYSTVEASDRVEAMRYDGSERRMVIPSASSIAADVLPFAPGTIALRPLDLRYDQRLPVVVWVADRFEWSDARAALMKDAEVALLVTTRAPDEALWKAIRETPWLDASRMVTVGARAAEGTSIVGDPSVPAGRYRRSGRVVAVAPPAIQSFAAGFLADQWKRTSPTHGSSR